MSQCLIVCDCVLKYFSLVYRTALMTASWGGRTDVVEVLIKHGADVNARDKVKE